MFVRAVAASWHRSEIVELLLMHGADPCRADLNGLTPLHCAVIYGDLNSVRLLIQTQKFDLHQKIATVRNSPSPKLSRTTPNSWRLWSILAAQGTKPQTSWGS